MSTRTKNNNNVEVRLLKKALRTGSRKALRENRALNRPTLVARNGKLIRIKDNGDQVEVDKTKKPVKLSKKTYKLD